MKIAAAMLVMLVIAAGPPQTQTYEAVYGKAMKQWKAKDYPNAEKSFDRLYQMAWASHNLDKQYDMLGWLG